MDLLAVMIVFFGIFFFVEVLFFVTCYRWLSSGKRSREKDFALLDKERGELLELQSALRGDVVEAKSLAEDAVNKLRALGAEVHAEWQEMNERIQSVVTEFESASHGVVEENLTKIAKQRLAIEKIIRNAEDIEKRLLERKRDMEKVLKVLDRTVPVEQILKDLQSEKYSEAKGLLLKGQEPVAIAKRLGLSLNEVALLSHTK